MTRSASDKTNIAVLAERLTNFMSEERERHEKLDKHLEEERLARQVLAKQLEGYFKIQIGTNGSSREKDIKDLLLDHEKDNRDFKTKFEALEQRRALNKLIEKHPRVTGLIVLLVGLGLYYAGYQGLLLKLVSAFRPF